MRLQTSNCRYKNAITVHAVTTRVFPSSHPWPDWGNSRAHLAPNVALKFTHFVTEKNARLGERRKRGTLRNFKGGEINFLRGATFTNIIESFFDALRRMYSEVKIYG